MGPHLNNLYGKNSVFVGGTGDGIRRVSGADGFCYTSGFLI